MKRKFKIIILGLTVILSACNIQNRMITPGEGDPTLGKTPSAISVPAEGEVLFPVTGKDNNKGRNGRNKRTRTPTPEYSPTPQPLKPTSTATVTILPSSTSTPSATPTETSSETSTPSATPGQTGGVLQFKSGFENNVYIDNNDFQQNRFIKGFDLLQPTGINNWGNFAENLPWVKHTNAYFQGGWMEIISDPFDSSNNVLHFFNDEAVLQNGKFVSRSQWNLKQKRSWNDDGAPNLFFQQFYRFKLLIPKDITTVYSFNESADWYMIWESHAWESEYTRYGIYIKKASNSDLWYFQMVQQEGGAGGQILWKTNHQVAVAVPFGEWFTFDIFFKYHEIDGEFYAAIATENGARQVLGHFKGRTKFGSKLHDQMMFKMYHSGEYISRLQDIGLDGTHQYYDDFEIWSDYPPGYWD